MKVGKGSERAFWASGHLGGVDAHVSLAQHRGGHPRHLQLHQRVLLLNVHIPTHYMCVRFELST